MTSLVVPPPLINIPLERIMKCRCGFSTKDGNLIGKLLFFFLFFFFKLCCIVFFTQFYFLFLAKHFVKCSAGRKLKASGEKRGSSGMLDSLGLVPKNT